MIYAVIKTGGKQYKVIEGEVVEVEKLEGKDKSKIVFDQVLLIADEDKLKVGKPLIKGAKVQAEIVAQVKGEKIRIAKFKAKSKYRKVQGHRQKLTQVKIIKIN